MKIMLGNVSIFNSLKSYLSLHLPNLAEKFDHSTSEVLMKRFSALARIGILSVENKEQQ